MSRAKSVRPVSRPARRWPVTPCSVSPTSKGCHVVLRLLSQPQGSRGLHLGRRLGHRCLACRALRRARRQGGLRRYRRRGVQDARRDDRHSLEEVTPAYWDERIAVNLRHQFFAIQTVAPGMKKAGGGSIVNFSSVSYHTMTADLAVYQAAKAAVIGMTRGLARDLGPDRIRLNAITPGWIMTQRQIDLWLTPQAEAGLMQAQCLNEKLYPPDIARIALWLAADDSRLVTAQNFVVDGGRM